MTNKERELLRHALGADSDSPGYRNYFAASPGTPNDRAWKAMVASGLARGPWSREVADALRFYSVSEAGQDAIGIKETP